jgi:rhodanese-related sulfurtransferase
VHAFLESIFVKFLMDNWQLLLVALTAGGMLIWPLIKESAGNLTPQAAVQLINRERALMIDVSDAEEFALAHAKGSKNIPLKDLDAKLGAAVKNKDTPVIFVCPIGKRATSAATAAKKLGYTKAVALSGGLRAWTEANLPVERAAA